MISFSQKELQYLEDKEPIKLKNKCTKKIERLFINQGKKLHQKWGHLPLFRESPKVSRGENLKGFPFRLLDYPRNFSKAHICSIRALFWWGHGLTLTLHLKGEFLKKLAPSLPKNIKALNDSTDSIYIANSGNEWEHELTTESYAVFHHLKDSQSFLNQNSPFLKVCSHYPIAKLENFSSIHQSFIYNALNPNT